jgi:predicted tellurium resistance membrane protein TerC
MDFSVLFSGTGLFYLIMLTLLEIVLGIDNIIFISIVTDKLDSKNQKYARRVGLGLALIVRLILLTLAAWIMSMTETLFTLFSRDFSGQSIVLLVGGLFLIYKSSVEMHENIKGHAPTVKEGKDRLKAVIFQIIMIDIVFSFDSIITAIGLTKSIKQETGGDPMIIIYCAVIISMIIMLIFAKQVSDFINKRPTIKMIALAFLVTIGAVLVAEAFGEEVPKGYIYFAMFYALIVEFLNIKMRKNENKHSIKD